MPINGEQIGPAYLVSLCVPKFDQEYLTVSMFESKLTGLAQVEVYSMQLMAVFATNWLSIEVRKSDAKPKSAGDARSCDSSLSDLRLMDSEGPIPFWSRISKR